MPPCSFGFSAFCMNASACPYAASLLCLVVVPSLNRLAGGTARKKHLIRNCPVPLMGVTINEALWTAGRKRHSKDLRAHSRSPRYPDALRSARCEMLWLGPWGPVRQSKCTEIYTRQRIAGKSATKAYVSSAESARAGNPESGMVFGEASERPRARLKGSGRFSALRHRFGGPLSSQKPFWF